MRKVLGLALIVGAALLSQTRITAPQLAGAPSAAGMVYVVTAAGAVVMADLGPGLTLDTSGARPVLRASVLAPMLPTRVYGEVVAMPADGFYALKSAPAPGTLRLYRNGIRQSEGTDYTLSGVRITPAAAYAAGTADLLVADYETPAVVITSR